MKNIAKNVKRVISTVLVVMIMCILVMPTASAAAAPSQITVKRVEILSPLVDNAKYGFTIFNTADSKTVYCMDVEKKPLTTGQTANNIGNGDAGLLYILRNGYPTKEITGNDEIDKYITQAAIWWYLGEDKLSNEFKNATKATDIYELVPKYIKPMVAAARSAKDNQATPSLKLYISGKDFTKSADGKYYETPTMYGTIVAAPTYNVTISGGTANTIVTDTNNNVKATFKNNEKFKIRIPVSELKEQIKVAVNATAVGTTQKAKVYSTGDSTYQRVAGLYTDETNLSQKATVTATPKIPGKNYCKLVDGKYYGKAGNEVDKETYTKECTEQRSCEVLDGTYYDNAGNVVDKETYTKECETSNVVVVPNTSSNISPLAVALGMISIIAGAGIIVYRNRKNKILV